jgi:hypothetical protein
MIGKIAKTGEECNCCCEIVTAATNWTAVEEGLGPMQTLKKMSRSAILAKDV